MKKHSNTDTLRFTEETTKIAQDLETSSAPSQRIIKRLVSKRKLLHCNPPSKTYDESPAKSIDKRNIRLRMQLCDKDHEKDKLMKAGVKYLRNLG